MRETNYARAQRLWNKAHDELDSAHFTYWLCGLYGSLQAYNKFSEKILDSMDKHIEKLAAEKGNKR